MEQSLLKRAAIQSLALMLAVITLSYALQHYQTVTISASNLIDESALYFEEHITPVVSNASIAKELVVLTKEQKLENLTPYERLLIDSDQDLIEQLGGRFIVVKKPRGTSIRASMTDLYVKKSILLTLEGIEDNNISSGWISRVVGKELFQGDPVYTESVSIIQDEKEGNTKEVVSRDYGKDLSHGITVTTHPNPSGILYNTEILIELDTVYAYKMYEDANYYYIELRMPSEVYDKIVVIDPGHGGKDVGAISKDDKYYEKNINLDIALHLKKLLDQENIKVYYSRISDETVYLRPRVELANTVDADYFISIHCNSNVQSGPNGLEVLYYDTEFKGVKSRDLAKLFSQEIHKSLEINQRGVVQKQEEDIYIMDKAKIPMILIEIAYMSNRNDMNYLSVEANRKSVAEGIYNGILKAYEELPITK